MINYRLLQRTRYRHYRRDRTPVPLLSTFIKLSDVHIDIQPGRRARIQRGAASHWLIPDNE